jgi:AcrR family transcriptional regulator
MTTLLRHQYRPVYLFSDLSIHSLPSPIRQLTPFAFMKSDASAKPLRKKHEPVDDRLLATAGRCFIEDGFGFGIDDILAQSNVAKMSLYVKFQSKYGLIERLLDDAAAEWQKEIQRVAADNSLRGPAKILRFLKAICTLSRDLERRTGLIGQALLEFPRTGKEDETHKKKDLVHEKARHLQRELIKVLEALCRDAGIENPDLAARQVLLLANGYLIMESLLGKSQAVRLTQETAQVLIRTAKPAAPAQKPSLPRNRVRTPGIDYILDPGEPEEQPTSKGKPPGFRDIGPSKQRPLNLDDASE